MTIVDPAVRETSRTALGMILAQQRRHKGDVERLLEGLSAEQLVELCRCFSFLLATLMDPAEVASSALHFAEDPR